MNTFSLFVTTSPDLHRLMERKLLLRNCSTNSSSNMVSEIVFIMIEVNSCLFKELHRLSGVKSSNTTPYHHMVKLNA